MPPGATEVAHRHLRAHQFFYVLAGELTLEVDGTRVTARTGEGVSVPAGVVHCATNNGSVAAEFLAIAGPSNEDDRVEETSRPTSPR
jgi:mannose-6-phosphate isomerase-like protein (cupin superfamily)